MARGPTIRIPHVGHGVKGGDIADFARRVGAEPVDVDVAMSAATVGTALHGLNRRYLGGYIIGVTAGHASNIAVATPELSESMGYDTTKLVVVTTQTAFTGTVRVRML